MIRWTEQAAEQLEGLYNFIASSNSEDVAEHITERILQSVEELSSFPMSGRPGRLQNTRELVIPKTPFIVVYTLDKDRIVILAIYHGAQQWPKRF